MYLDISSLDSQDLITVYNRLDGELKAKLLEGVLWEEVKDKIDYLTEVSKELSKRSVNIGAVSNTPADFQIRQG